MVEEEKNKLVELYRKALSNLQTAASNEEAANAYQRAAETATIEAKEQQDEIASQLRLPLDGG